MTDRSGRRAALPEGGLTGLLAQMASAGDGHSVSLAEIIDATGRSGIAAALLVPALIAFSPATAMFGVASMSGLLIALLAAQIMLDRPTLWLPGFLLRQEIPRRHIAWIAEKLTPPLRFVERHSRPRLTILMRWPLGHVPGAVTFVVGASLPMLELVPLSATTGGFAVTLMVLGLLLDDGLLVAVGMAAAAVVAALIVSVVSGVLF